jgi:hypothetical protein
MLDKDYIFKTRYILSQTTHATYPHLIVHHLPSRIEGPWHPARWVCVTEFINMHASRLSWRFRLARYPVSPAFLTGVIRRKIRCDAARVEMRSAAHVAALDLTGKFNFQYPIAEQALPRDNRQTAASSTGHSDTTRAQLPTAHPSLTHKAVHHKTTHPPTPSPHRLAARALLRAPPASAAPIGSPYVDTRSRPADETLKA